LIVVLGIVWLESQMRMSEAEEENNKRADKEEDHSTASYSGSAVGGPSGL
jgi:hypothetical protein